MPQNPGATLVAEIGSVTTRVTLVDIVDGEMRMIGQASVPSTTEPPLENAVIGILEAATQLSETTGRQLMRDGSLLMPQTPERDGVDQIVALTSASPTMGLVIAAVAGEVSARSAQRASRATYTLLLQTVTLNDAASSAVAGDNGWIERQVQSLMDLHPDLVVIAGGLEDGAEDALVRLAHIVGLTTYSSRVDAEGQSRRDITKRKIIFAGNSRARERVIEALSGRAELHMVDNVRPALEAERLDPTRQMITKLYNETLLPALPGASALRRLSQTPLISASDATGLITRFIAEQGRATLTLDCGSSNTAAYLARKGQFSPFVYGGIGTGYGIGGLLAERGVAAIARWLPFAISERDLTHWLLNKMLRPYMLPATREDLLIEHAVAREALGLVIAELHDEQSDFAYDYVLAGGGVLGNAPHPGLAALTILDALQPRNDHSNRAVELHLDTLGLTSSCGALAFSDPEAALTLFERDLRRNTPLATCVVALGGGKPGDVAVEAELKEVGGSARRIAVEHGQIGRLALGPNRKAELTLWPAGNVRIGRNEPGAEVKSDVAAIGGSALGIIIDARGRPLRLPSEPRERQQLLWNWLVALGVESGPLPYAPAPAAEVYEPAPETNGTATSSETAALSAAPPPTRPTDESAVLANDLAKLRQTVEEPKKKGFFRRR